MRLRTLVFWSHLGTGVLAGLVVLMMSATGVLLTYERQLTEWAEQQYDVAVPDNAQPLPVDAILANFEKSHPDEQHFEIRFVNRPGAAVIVWAGPEPFLLDPYTGAVIREGEAPIAEFFHFVTRMHRWFALDDTASFDAARAITAYSNLLFLFMILSGVYLWLPRVWRWPVLKTKLFFNNKARNAKARDYNWHHVFSFWALVPLFVICVSATIFYFPWANTALYAAFGEAVPLREEHPEHDPQLESGANAISNEQLLVHAKTHADDNGASDWYSIWMEVGETPGEARFYIDRSLGRRPPFAYALILNTQNASVKEVKRHDDYSPGDQAWGILRFLHTGEQFGFVGQTIAGLASLAACLLVYTGIALAWRRLVSPWLRKSRAV